MWIEYLCLLFTCENYFANYSCPMNLKYASLLNCNIKDIFIVPHFYYYNYIKIHPWDHSTSSLHQCFSAGKFWPPCEIWQCLEQLYNYDHCLNLEHLHHPKRNLISSQPLPSPLRQVLATTTLLSVSMVLSIWHISCKWSHTICGLLYVSSIFHLA